MIKKFRIMKTLPAYVLGVCLALSCNTEALQLQSPVGNGAIGFSVLEGQDSGTKGIPATSDNVASLYADNVRVTAFRGTSEYIPSQMLYSPSGENALWHTSESYFWPESGSLDFWAWAPADLSAVFNDSRSALSFDYSLPAPDPEEKQDAVGQKDIVLTWIRANRDSYAGGVPLAFGHPLSSIVFRGGTLRDGIVRSISLRNVYGGGSCVFDGSDFVWTPSGGLLCFTQIFNAPVSSSQEGEPITMAGSTKGERCFMMIPQTLGDDACMDVVFDDGKQVRTYSHSLAGSVWKPGISHTYTISLSSETSDGISVEEIFDKYTKDHVSIRNNGEASVYIRAMIEANWVDAEGCIVAPCDIRKDGIILDFNMFSIGGRWTAHTDGFYYYKKAVRPGRKTYELFTSYIPGPVPVPGSHLEITVAAQAVEYDVNQKMAKQAWGSDIPVTGAVE